MKTMKKYILPILMSLLVSAGMVSCFSDDSTLGDPSKVGSITIADMPASSIISYAGNRLTITPEITSDYEESDLTYAWYLYQKGANAENGFRENCISTDRNLDYEVNLPSGTYYIALEVKSLSTGLAQLAQTTLSTSTAFANGFYILKETEDGQTELDMVSDNGNFTNLITKMDGQPMPGKPVNLAVVYGQQFVDPETQEMSAANTVNVFTNNDYHSYRSEDMKLVFDRNSITYAGEDNTDNYLNLVNGYFYAFMLSKGGVSVKAYGEDMGLSTGKFGLPSIEGDYGKFMQVMKGGSKGMAVWDNANHGVYSIDYNCLAATKIVTDATGTQECIASGINRTGSNDVVWFLAENPANHQRFLHLINGKTGKLTETKELDSSLHLAKGSVVACCGGGAAYIYVIDGGKLYAYGWATDTEVEVSLPGVSGNVTFVTHQWLSDYYGAATGSDYDFSNLIVGVQSGNEYTLYFYNDLVGGVPNAEPYNTVKGTGKVQSIRRVVPSNIGMTNMMMSSYGEMTICPTSE